MNPANPESDKKLLTLKETAEKLTVSIATLLTWNEYNILKPTITLDGEIGYTQEQIDQFLTIQKLAKHGSVVENFGFVQQNIPPSYVSSAQVPETEQSKSETVVGIDGSSNLNSSGNGILSYGIILSLSVIVIALCASILTDPNGLKLPSGTYPLTSQKDDNGGKVLAAQTGNLDIEQASPSKTKSGLVDRNLSNEGNTLYENNRSKLASIFGKKIQQINTATSQSAKTVISLAKKNGEVSARTSASISAYTTTYSEMMNPTASDSCPSCSDEKNNNNLSFDEKGDIKSTKEDDNSSGLLATTLGVGESFIDSNPLATTSSSNNLLAFLTVALLSSVFIFRKQIFYGVAVRKSEVYQAGPAANIDNIPPEKVLTIDQKTDGTVLLNFEGNEIKISKPELDSESDQFFARLMELSNSSDSKEMDYDNSKDEKIRLTAPLSRLVTRLGFVGIKRDLFFPRTSKNRVLFRKYITREDLVSMNLTVDQIEKEITKVTN